MKRLTNRRTKELEKDLTLYRYTFKTDIIDEDFFNKGLRAKSKRLTALIKENKELENPHPYLENLILDLFQAYNRYYLRPLTKNEVYSDYYLNYFTVKEIMKMDDFKEIREISKRDDFTSLIAVEAIIPSVVKVIKELKETNEDLKNFLKEVKKDLEEREKSEEGQTIKEVTSEEIEKALKKSVKHELKTDLESSKEALLAEVKTMQGFGVETDGTFCKLPYEEKIKTLKELRENRKIQEVSKLAGRLKAIYKKGRKVWTKEGMDSITGTTRGSDLSSTLTHDLSYISNKAYKKLFYKKMIDNDLTNYDYGSKRTKGKGPIVAVIDVSGTMRGERDTYAKATFMALLEVCRKQKREMYVILFSSESNPRTVSFSRSELNNPKKLIEVITYFSGNGTLFEPPLRKAQEVIKSSKVFRKSDIVFITDGDSRFTGRFVGEFNSWKAVNKISVYAILIGSGARRETVQKVSDTISELESIKGNEEEASKDLFRYLDLKDEMK